MTSKHKQDTLLVHSGRHPFDNHGVVNPPVYHASTILFPSIEALEDAKKRRWDTVNYGRTGTPTSWALEEAVATLEGGYRAVCAPSGLGAITLALMAMTKAGDHVLVTDNVYTPSRIFADRLLRRFGVEVTYFDPLIGSGLADLMQDNTKVVFLEAPGSITFEVPDTAALTSAAKQHGATVLFDNTWATPLYFKPFDHGVDVSIHAATKYIVGHSDAMMGIVSCVDEDTFEKVKLTASMMGTVAGPDDVYLAQRGLRTMGVRLRQHQESALAIADWLQGRDEVARVRYPALPGAPGHDLWRRDFTGASGLFGVELKPCSAKAVAALCDHMELFGMGYSWGGYESLIVPQDPSPTRTATKWHGDGPMVRLHIGLEDIDDLKADLAAGLDRLRQADHA